MQEEVDRKTAREQSKLEREEKLQERANAEKRLKAEYHKLIKTPAFMDLALKLQEFTDYHAKIAKDGVGYEKVFVDGREEQKIVRLTPEQRVSEMDKAAGIEEIIDYLERKTTITVRAIKKGQNNG